MKESNRRPFSTEIQEEKKRRIDEVRALNEKLTLINEELSVTNAELKAYQNKLEELVAIRTHELKKKEESLNYKNKLEHLLTGISTRFFNLSPELVDDCIVNSLRELCDFFNGEAAFLGEIIYSENSYGLTHIWNNDKISFNADYFKKAPLSDIMWWLEKIHEQDVFIVDYRQAGSEKYALKDSDKLSGTGKISFVPIIFQGNIVGFTGLSSLTNNPVWAEDEVTVFHQIGEVFVNALKRKESEKILMQSEERFRSIVQFLTDIILIVDEKINIQYESPSCSQVLGYPPGVLIGMHGLDIIHPDDKSYVLKDLMEVLHNQNDHKPTEFRAKNAKGKWISLEVVANNMLNHPAIQGIVITGRDVTDRRRVEKALKISETKFRNIFNNSSDPIVIISRNYKFLEVNDVFRNATGYTAKDTRMMKLTEIITDPYLPHLVENLVVILRGDHQPALECEIKCKDRQTFPAEINSKLIDFEGEMALISVIRNITERKQLESRILDTIISTEEKEREKFARNLHDELGPLLSSIKMYVNSLSTSIEKPKHDFITSQLRIILKEVIQSTKELSNDLSPHVLANYGLIAALEWYVNQLKPYISIAFDTNLKDERFPSSLELSVYRIIKELLNNTIKHARAQKINIRLFLILKSLHLHYDDNGSGFNEKWHINYEFMGMGMSNIISRCRSINATSKFFNNAPNGMAFEMQVPVDDPVG